MNNSQSVFTAKTFAKTFIVPGLLIFLVPVISLAFFYHAESHFNASALESLTKQICADSSLSTGDRAKAISYFTYHPFSELVLNDKFASTVDSKIRFDFFTFRWIIRLAVISIIASLAVFLVAGLCVALSLRSQQAQYFSLSVGWQLLRIYGALQAIIQGILLFALSYWVTALWFQFYSVKLIAVAGGLAVFGVAGVIAAIFKKTKSNCEVAGTIISNESASALWNELHKICENLSTAPPEQIILGIDDNFFCNGNARCCEWKNNKRQNIICQLVSSEANEWC